MSAIKLITKKKNRKINPSNSKIKIPKVGGEKGKVVWIYIMNFSIKITDITFMIVK